MQYYRLLARANTASSDRRDCHRNCRQRVEWTSNCAARFDIGQTKHSVCFSLCNMFLLSLSCFASVGLDQ